MKNALLPMLLAINLSGCAGYYYSKPSDPAEKELKSALLVVPKEEQKLWKPKEFKSFRDERELSTDYQDPLKKPVIKETKVYKEKTIWCGRTIWAIIPIPLWSPSCRTYTELTFENGMPISAREQHLEGSGYVCGPFVPLLGNSEEYALSGFCADINIDDYPPDEVKTGRKRKARATQSAPHPEGGVDAGH
ncbi:MAG: hypothetical protein ABI479_03120 [Gallionella sp.]